MSHQPVRVGIIGAGNCASSFVQGLHYYRNAPTDAPIPGLMNTVVGPYHTSDAEISCAFDVHAAKVGKDLSEAVEKKAYTFATSIVKNNGDGSFAIEPLPLEAQISPVYGILPADFDGDGKLDLLLGGNFEGVKPEIGSLTAGYGLYLRGDGKGHFTSELAKESGFFVPGQVRDISRVRTATGDLYIVARNNDRPLVFRASKNAKRPALTAGRR